MVTEDASTLEDKYLVLKLAKEIDLNKLLKSLRAYQRGHRDNPIWGDLAEILSSAEIDQVQTKIGEFINKQEF